MDFLRPSVGAEKDGGVRGAVVEVVGGVDAGADWIVGAGGSSHADVAFDDPPGGGEFNAYFARGIVVELSEGVFLDGVEFCAFEIHTLHAGESCGVEDGGVISRCSLSSD